MKKVNGDGVSINEEDDDGAVDEVDVFVWLCESWR